MAASSEANVLDKQPEAPTQPPTMMPVADAAASAAPTTSMTTVFIGGPDMAPLGGPPQVVSARRAKAKKGFRVGEALHSYEYYETEKSCNGKPVYRCIRGKNLRADTRLYLYRHDDGCWIATEAGMDDADPVANGTPTFKTQDSIEDISVPKSSIPWQWFVPESQQWQGSMAFHTYGLTPPAD